MNFSIHHQQLPKLTPASATTLNLLLTLTILLKTAHFCRDHEFFHSPAAATEKASKVGVLETGWGFGSGMAQIISIYAWDAYCLILKVNTIYAQFSAYTSLDIIEDGRSLIYKWLIFPKFDLWVKTLSKVNSKENSLRTHKWNFGNINQLYIRDLPLCIISSVIHM